MDLLKIIIKMASPEFMKMLEISFATLEIKYGPEWVEQLRSQMIKAPVSEEARNTVLELASQKLLNSLSMSQPSSQVSTPIDLKVAGKFELPSASDESIPYLKSVGKTALPSVEKITPPQKTTAPKKKKAKSKEVVECQSVMKQDELHVVETNEIVECQPVMKQDEIIVVENPPVMKSDETIVVEKLRVMKSNEICVTTQSEETSVVKPTKKKKIIREKKTPILVV